MAWKGNVVPNMSNAFNYGDGLFMGTTPQSKEAAKIDKQEMRKWAKKSKKALLLELVRLQKQCHENYAKYENEKAARLDREQSHLRETIALKNETKGVLEAIRAFRSES